MNPTIIILGTVLLATGAALVYGLCKLSGDSDEQAVEQMRTLARRKREREGK